VRTGGHPWSQDEVEERLRAHAFEQIEGFFGACSVAFVAGRRKVW
jgi:hypothetical protein